MMRGTLGEQKLEIKVSIRATENPEPGRPVITPKTIWKDLQASLQESSRAASARSAHYASINL
jgi:hypothetical protein